MAILGVRLQGDDRLRLVEAEDSYPVGSFVIVEVDHAQRNARVIIAPDDLLSAALEVTGQVIGRAVEDEPGERSVEASTLGGIGHIRSEHEADGIALEPPMVRLGDVVIMPTGAGIITRLHILTNQAAVTVEPDVDAVIDLLRIRLPT